MHACALGGSRHVHREIIRQGIGERIEAMNRGAQCGGIGAIHAAGRNALRGEFVERGLIAVECAEVIVAGCAEHMRNGVTDQTCTNDGNFHVLLLCRSERRVSTSSGSFRALSPASGAPRSSAARGGLTPRTTV